MGGLRFLGYSLVFSFVMSALVGCSKKSDNAIKTSGDSNSIFSNRPQIYDRDFILIKLKNPALLTSVAVKNGKRVVDPGLKKAIDQEQIQLLKDLELISTEISVVYRYRMILNAVAVIAPVSTLDKIKALPSISYAEKTGTFARPAALQPEMQARGTLSIKDHNSVKFIGASAAQARGVRGQGLRIGIIDTGIDYTHAMFGGSGTEEAYKAIDPAKMAAGFPSQKVVGGTDLVGTEFDASSADFTKRLPKPDANPLDEGGHGTHVAGTVAGIGDGIDTYDGVAPDASLYAIKVFGAEGSTSDSVVIAALEYAADPNADGDPSDSLDVVNLSLGGGFGEPHVLYNESIGILSRAGTVVVAAAGNSGDEPYIVGSPSVSDDALSVASSLDDSDQNWRFRAVRFSTVQTSALLAEAIEAAFSEPITKSGDVRGNLVFVGFAEKDLDADLAAKVNGQVAFIDRGLVSFYEKAERAVNAGAIGVVIANSTDEEPIIMGADPKAKKFKIPAIMISKAIATELKAALKLGDVAIQFQTELKIEKPELIDTISGFSSKGPRSIDGMIKPEIAAPGNKVISAKMGGGKASVQLSGTSMAAPHMTGVMALIKQAHPGLSVEELKSLAMGTAKTIQDNNGQDYPVSRQGAGRIEVLKAIDAKILSLPAALSLGEVPVETAKTLVRPLSLKNISDQPLKLTLEFAGSKGLRMTAGPEALDLGPGETKSFSLRFTVDSKSVTQGSAELDGLVKFRLDGAVVLHVPVLAIANKVSRVKAESLKIRATSDADAEGAVVDLRLRNASSNTGDAYAFNLLALGARKEDPQADSSRSRECDLAGAGYRVIQRDGESVLQFAVKLYAPVTTWDLCDISVLIDADADGVADQELVGTKPSSIKGLKSQKFESVLLDAAMAKKIRRQFELDTIAKKEKVEEDYTSAVSAFAPMFAFEHSTVAILEAKISNLRLKPTGELAIRIATTSGSSRAVEPDDFLEKDEKKWMQLSVAERGASYVGLADKYTLGAGADQVLSFTKGAGQEALWILYPQNKPVLGGGTVLDSQSEIVSSSYEVEP